MIWFRKIWFKYIKKYKFVFEFEDLSSFDIERYKEALWDFNYDVENRISFGASGNPFPKLENSSHIVLKTWIKNNKVFGKIQFLDTSIGRVIKNLLNMGCKNRLSIYPVYELDYSDNVIIVHRIKRFDINIKK